MPIETTTSGNQSTSSTPMSTTGPLSAQQQSNTDAGMNVQALSEINGADLIKLLILGMKENQTLDEILSAFASSGEAVNNTTPSSTSENHTTVTSIPMPTEPVTKPIAETTTEPSTTPVIHKIIKGLQILISMNLLLPSYYFFSFNIIQ